jgi:hypothetical protein
MKVATALRTLVAGLMLIASAALPAHAFLINVDSGPWWLGSGGTPTNWYNQSVADNAAGTFVNMRNGTHPGTTLADPIDFMNFPPAPMSPKLLYWFYYLPGQNAATVLGSDLLQTKLVIDWGGTEYALQADHMNWGANNDAAWLAPGTLTDCASGVAGHMRFSWAMSSFGSTVDEYRAGVLSVQRYVRGEVRYRETTNGDWTYAPLQVDVTDVPEPGTLTLLGLVGLAGLAVAVRGRRK